MYNMYPSPSLNQPIMNPRIPFNGELPNGLQPGSQIIISGCVPYNPDNFQIDLKSNYGVGLHLNPRFYCNTFVRNHEQNGNWGPEEKSGSLPLYPNKAFELIIAAEFDQFKILIDGQYVFDFRYRVPLQEIRGIGIEGDVQIFKITFSGSLAPGGYQPIPPVFPPYQPVPPAVPPYQPSAAYPANDPYSGAASFQPNVPYIPDGPQNGNPNVFNPSVPCFIPIANRLIPGKMIQITGKVHKHAKRFNVNLQTGPGENVSNAALHFSVRWNDPSIFNSTCSVRNNLKNGSWGFEEKPTPGSRFPFSKNGDFEILIMLEPSQWKIAVNGQHYCEFGHRNPYEEVTHIAITGDVHINTIKQY